jgi:hypothetical protein
MPYGTYNPGRADSDVGGGGGTSTALPGGVPATATGPFTFAGSFTAAQTNLALATAAAGRFMYLTRFGARLSKATTATSVAVRAGFGAAATPAVGNAALVDGHPGIDPGGGFNSGTGGAVIARGGDGDDLFMDSAAATGGVLEIYGTFWLATV